MLSLRCTSRLLGTICSNLGPTTCRVYTYKLCAHSGNKRKSSRKLKSFSRCAIDVVVLPVVAKLYCQCIHTVKPRNSNAKRSRREVEDFVVCCLFWLCLRPSNKQFATHIRLLTPGCCRSLDRELRDSAINTNASTAAATTIAASTTAAATIAFGATTAISNNATVASIATNSIHTATLRLLYF